MKGIAIVFYCFSDFFLYIFCLFIFNQGGGERPTTDGVLEEVLAVLAPAAKEGVVARGEGETIPGEGTNCSSVM